LEDGLTTPGIAMPPGSLMEASDSNTFSLSAAPVGRGADGVDVMALFGNLMMTTAIH
jgi:hypothetical protein